METAARATFAPNTGWTSGFKLRNSNKQTNKQTVGTCIVISRRGIPFPVHDKGQVRCVLSAYNRRLISASRGYCGFVRTIKQFQTLFYAFQFKLTALAFLLQALVCGLHVLRGYVSSSSVLYIYWPTNHHSRESFSKFGVESFSRLESLINF